MTAVQEGRGPTEVQLDSRPPAVLSRRLRAAVAGVAVLSLWFLGCVPVGEVSNPNNFRVIALVDGPDGFERIDVDDAWLSCTEFTDTDPSEGVRDSRCSGKYVLESDSGELRITYSGVGQIRPGRHPLGEGVGLSFRGARGHGTVTLSRSVRRETSAWSAGEWYVDVAGTFGVEAGDYKLSQGLFYSER